MSAGSSQRPARAAPALTRARPAALVARGCRDGHCTGAGAAALFSRGGGTFASESRALLALPGRTGARCALTRTFLPCWPASMSSLASYHGRNPPFAMLGAGLSCCKASCHAAGHEAQVLPFRTISEKCGVRSEDCLDGPRSFFPRFVSLNWGLGRRGQAPGVAGAASRAARAAYV